MENTLLTICSFRFNISHIFKKGNACANRLANADFLLSLHFVGLIPICAFESFLDVG